MALSSGLNDPSAYHRVPRSYHNQDNEMALIAVCSVSKSRLSGSTVLFPSLNAYASMTLVGPRLVHLERASDPVRLSTHKSEAEQ